MPPQNTTADNIDFIYTTLPCITLHSSTVQRSFSLNNGTTWTDWKSTTEEQELDVTTLHTSPVEAESLPIYVRYRDDVGNISAAGTLTHTYNIDTIPPQSPTLKDLMYSPMHLLDIPCLLYRISLD